MMTADVTDADRPELGEQLRELLQQLVDDGTLDAAQADAVIELLIGEPPGATATGATTGPAASSTARFDGEVVAGLLGIDVETLAHRTARRAARSPTSLWPTTSTHRP